jgi:hypothetical protein
MQGGEKPMPQSSKGDVFAKPPRFRVCECGENGPDDILKFPQFWPQ